jgi:phosphogluconate dehydratase
MSGASGKVPAAIHIWPEAEKGGNIAKVRTGDLLRLDAVAGRLEVLETDFESRQPVAIERIFQGCGRELFAKPKTQVSHAELGGSFLI